MVDRYQSGHLGFLADAFNQTTKDSIRNDLAELRKAGRIELRKQFKRFKSSGRSLPMPSQTRLRSMSRRGLAVAAQSGGEPR